MSSLSYEVPCLDVELERELSEIRSTVRDFIDLYKEKERKDKQEKGVKLKEGEIPYASRREKKLEARLAEITSPEYIDLINRVDTETNRRTTTEAYAFHTLLEEYLLPEERVEDLSRRWANQELMAEGILTQFVNDFLLKHFFAGADGNILEHDHYVMVEGRCQTTGCPFNNRITRTEYETVDPVLEQEFYYELLASFSPTCRGKIGRIQHDTKPVSSANIVYPSSGIDSILHSVQWRLKSGGRLLDKFIDYVMGDRDEGINDQLAARVVTNRALGQDEKETLEGILQTIKDSFLRTVDSRVMDEYVIFKKVDGNLNPIYSNGQEHSMERAPRCIEVLVPIKGLIVGLQLMLNWWYHEMEAEYAGLDHPRYFESQEEQRAKRETINHIILKAHLKPIFERD
ncbi:hypothetical protein KY320_01125 [Candidatus Woesearchaeota archaeon]|nr:hypothetical protein [Candidatus Woesearchaeota archaeon]